MRFDEWKYLYPPRPDAAVAKGVLHYYETEGWIAQVKMNGTCNVMAVAPDRKTIKAMSRHKDDHKLWQPGPQTTKIFKKLPGAGWYVFVSELMHSKVPGIKDINYIHDVLVADGEYLVGKTLIERQELLRSLFGITSKSKCTISHYVLDANTWLARNHSVDFPVLFEELDRPEYEGLVMKDPKSKLGLCMRETSNRTWQVKCRAPSKNYGF